MYTNKNLEVISDNAVYKDSKGVQYPRNFPKASIAELHKVTETTPPADKIVEGFYIDEEYNQVWNARDKTAEELENEMQGQALSALYTSDSVALRCIKAGVDFPAEWQSYVIALRDVVNGVSGFIPPQPEYPAGT